jgi:uncharacterized tellurite resistance protein B-like protein
MTQMADVQERHAMARLIAMTMMADGRLANFELAALDAHDIPKLVGLPRDALLQAVIDLCRELLDEQTGDRIRVTDPAHVDALLDAVTGSEARLLVVRAMLVLSKSDGTISAPEQDLLRRALTRWDLTLEAVAA